MQVILFKLIKAWLIAEAEKRFFRVLEEKVKDTETNFDDEALRIVRVAFFGFVNKV